MNPIERLKLLRKEYQNRIVAIDVVLQMLDVNPKPELIKDKPKHWTQDPKNRAKMLANIKRMAKKNAANSK